MSRQRILVDIESVEQARKIEETVSSGYLDATIEHLLQWIAVEEDLISSYNQLSSGGSASAPAEVFRKFASSSEGNLERLNAFLAECDAMKKEREERLSVLNRLESRQGGSGSEK